MLRGPRLRDDRRRRALLTTPQRVSKKRPMTLMPGGFNEDTPEMRIAGFGDRAARLSRPTGMLRGHESHERHGARRRGESARIAQFGGDRQRGEIVDPSETAQALDSRPQRLEVEQ